MKTSIIMLEAADPLICTQSCYSDFRLLHCERDAFTRVPLSFVSDATKCCLGDTEADRVSSVNNKETMMTLHEGTEAGQKHDFNHGGDKMKDGASVIDQGSDSEVKLW